MMLDPIRPEDDRLSAVERAVLDQIDMDRLLAFLADLVAIRSLDGRPEEVAAQKAVAAQLERLGLDVETWEIDFASLSRHPAYSAEVDRPHGIGVVGRMGHGRARSLILNGHVDVVPAGEAGNWTRPPWELTVDDETGLVYGRGALDMKGGLCCALFAADAIRRAGVELDGELLIQSVMGEEDGGCGTLAAVQRGYRADAAVIMEPTEMMVAPAQGGALNFRVTIPGRAAHGALRAEGVDPLEKFMLIYQAILAYEEARNGRIDQPLFAAYGLPAPICVGTIRGGVWASTVAETLTFEGRFGVAVGEDVAAARREFEGVIAQAAEADPWLCDHPPTLTWWGGQFAPASIHLDHPIIGAVTQSYADVNAGKAAVVRGMPYGADMRLLVNEGDTPTVMFGPGDIRRAHRPDECVPLADLETVTRTLAVTILRFCGGFKR